MQASIETLKDLGLDPTLSGNLYASLQISTHEQVSNAPESDPANTTIRRDSFIPWSQPQQSTH